VSAYFVWDQVLVFSFYVEFGLPGLGLLDVLEGLVEFSPLVEAQDPKHLVLIHIAIPLVFSISKKIVICLLLGTATPVHNPLGPFACGVLELTLFGFHS
jgi:hypothetical protein